MLERRAFLRGLICAPAVVAASSLMPVRALKLLRPPVYGWTRMISYKPGDTITWNDYEYRILEPMIDKMKEQIAEAIMNGTFGAFPGFDGLHVNWQPA
jgi:hypothetical protein